MRQGVMLVITSTLEDEVEPGFLSKHGLGVWRRGGGLQASEKGEVGV